VKLALLTGTVKLFFQRPPEVHAMLGKLLVAATSDSTGESQDVRDRGLLYYRMLRYDVNAAKMIISDSARRTISSFAEDQEVQIKDALFNEFNSLSIIYSKLQRHFIAPEKRPFDASAPNNSSSSSGSKSTLKSGNVTAAQGTTASSNDGDSLLGGDEYSGNDMSSAIYGAPVDLLGNDLLSMGFGDAPTSSSSAVPATAMSSNSTNGSQFSLKSSCDMSEARFQELWQEWEPTQYKEEGLMLPGVSTKEVNADLCFKHLTLANVFTMASGDLEDTVKLFL
jgi:hypothetical protein